MVTAITALALAATRFAAANLSWLQLCLQAQHLTGEARYADAMERTLHKALLGALQPDGHWWAYFLQLEGFDR